jgi:hypothetical protein
MKRNGLAAKNGAKPGVCVIGTFVGPTGVKLLVGTFFSSFFIFVLLFLLAKDNQGDRQTGICGGNPLNESATSVPEMLKSKIEVKTR